MAIFTTFGKQKDDKNTLFPGGVSVKSWNDLLGLLRIKEFHTNTQLHIKHGVKELRNLICGFLEWSFEVEWSQMLCSLVGFTETNTELFL